MEYIIIGIIVATIVFMLSGIRVVNQYQRGVVLTLGRFSGQRAPGLRVVVPIFPANYDGRCPLDADRCAKARGHYER